MRAVFVAQVAVIAVSLGIAGCRSDRSRISSTRGTHADLPSFEFSALPSIPDPLGFAGSYAGVSNGAIVVAGGSNFPDGPPWTGKKKAWSDCAFVLPPGADTWRRVEHALPSVRGYGASITTTDGVVLIGGGDASRNLADVFQLRYEHHAVTLKALPSLPLPLANCSAATIGTTIYVIGGITTPGATRAEHLLFALDLSEASPAWRELEPVPGPGRMLAVAGGSGGDIYVAGGASLSADAEGKPLRTYLKDAYRYRPGEGWSRIADLPHPTAAAPSPAIPIAGGGFAILGGDTGADVNFEPKEQHPGFSHDVLAYNPSTDAWSAVGQLPLGQVTATVAPFGDGFVIPGGEVRPAVRTPQVALVRPIK